MEHHLTEPISIYPKAIISHEIFYAELKKKPQGKVKSYDITKQVLIVNVILLLLLLHYITNYVSDMALWLKIVLSILMVALLIFPSLMLRYFIISRLNERKARKENHKINTGQEVKEYLFEAEQITIVTLKETIKSSWETLMKLEEYPSFVIIYPTNKIAYIVSKQDISEEQWKRLKQLLQHWREINGKIALQPD